MKFKNKFIILLTGTSGLFGINYYNRFRDKYKTYFLINNRNLKNIKKKVFVDLKSKKKIKELILKKKINIIIHAASFTNIEYIEKNKKASYKNNFLTTKNIAEVCKETNTKLVYISTDQLYSDNLKKYDEKSELTPLNYYGYLKKISEIVVYKNSKKNLIIRTNFFCIGTSYRKSLSDYIIDNIKFKKNIYMFNDIFFSPVYVMSLIKIILKLISSNEKGIFNISSDDKISKYKFAIYLAKLFKLDKTYIKKASINDFKMVKRPKNMYLINKKIKQKLKLKKIDIIQEIKSLKKDYNRKL